MCSIILLIFLMLSTEGTIWLYVHNTIIEFVSRIILLCTLSPTCELNDFLQNTEMIESHTCLLFVPKCIEDHLLSIWKPTL